MSPMPDPHPSFGADPASGGDAEDGPSTAGADERSQAHESPVPREEPSRAQSHRPGAASAEHDSGPDALERDEPPAGDDDAGRQEEPEAFRRLDPASVPAARMGSFVALFVLAVPAATLLAVLPLEGSELDREQVVLLRSAAVALWLLLAVRAWMWPRMVYARTRYRLGGAALEIRRGVLFHTWNAVPRSRIQHTDVSSGPIQRRFGVATLQIHTAGTTNATVGLSGVSQQTAEALRDELMSGLLAREEDGV